MVRTFTAVFFILGVSVLGLLFDLQRTIRTPVTPVSASMSEQTGGGDASEQGIKTKEHYDLIAKRNVFAFSPTSGAAEESRTAQAAQPAQNLPPLNIRLRGTVISPQGYAMAMIEDRNQRKEYLFKAGDRIQDAVIHEIQNDRVVLVRGGGQGEVIRLFSGDQKSGPRPAARQPSGVTRSAQPPSSGSTQASSESVQSTKKLQRTRSLMSRLRLRPFTSGGKAVGFLVGRVPQGSPLEQAGLQKGDVIVGINDLEVSAPKQLFEAYRAVAEEEEIRLDVLRDGETETTIDLDLADIISSG